MPLDMIVHYLKTFSVYKTYKEQSVANGREEEDPIDKLAKALAEKVEDKTRIELVYPVVLLMMKKE